VPAHFCGVCAHKPTYGVVPTRGQLPPGLPAWLIGRDLAVIGPMARSVDDLALALDVIAGPDEAVDGRAYRVSLPPARAEKLKDYRVLVIAEHPLLPTSAAVGAALERLSNELAAAGADVKRETPLIPDLGASAKLYVKLLSAVLSSGMPDNQYLEMRKAAESIPAADQSLGAEFMRGALLSHRDWVQADFVAPGAETAVARPVPELRRRPLPGRRDAGLPHDHTEPQSSRTIAVDGKQFPYLNQLAWADPATTCGLPATVVPVAVADGLPIGVQIIGPEYEDRTPLAFARLIEREFGRFVAPPGYA